MVTEASTPDFRHLERMMMPAKRERPSTANTMVLVLKPRQEDYKQLAQISGSENEREAYRKNRVIQMKLGAYLAEVCLQQRSSARLLKTEEYRFMQEINRRSNVPRSVTMLQQLQNYTDKKFPNASYSYCEPSSQSQYSGSYKNPPLSARSPSRAYRQRGLLERPKTSATLFRQKLHDEAMENLYKVLDNTEAFVSLGAGDRQNVSKEEVFDLKEGDGLSQRPLTSGQTADLLPLLGKNSGDTNQNPSTVHDNMHPGQSSTEYNAGRKYSMQGKRAKSHMQIWTKQNSPSMNSSLGRTNTVSKFPSSDLPTREEERTDVDAMSNDSFEVDPKIASFLEDELKAFDKEEGINLEASMRTDFQYQKRDTQEVVDSQPNEDRELGIIDLDLQEEINRMQKAMISKEGKQGLKPGTKKTNFNRVKAAPVVPLRHNITSVLRQERAKYEASQNKVKDYLHKMTSRDFIARGQNGGDATSAATSRRSSGVRK